MAGTENDPDEAALKAVQAMQQACVDAALSAWEEAGMSGLCAEGRWELAVQRMREIDPESVVPPGE